MKLSTRRLDKRLAKLESTSRARSSFEQYRNDPTGYASRVLRVDWWEKQRQVAESLVKPPYRTLVKASHSVGKSHLAGGIVNWWFDTRRPSITITTAPKFDQVKDVIWKEVRLQRRGRGGFPGPKNPRLEGDTPDHYAAGVTAARAEGIQGQHGPAVLFVLDEAVGVPPYIWSAADSMMMGVEYAFLAICNPTETSSEFYRREQQTELPYTVISISCLDHPNIDRELDGLPPLYPAAVRLAWVDERIREWCEPVHGAAEETDILWPPRPGTVLGEPKLYRPGPDAEARLLGRWPSRTCGVWSDYLWGLCESVAIETPLSSLPVIGCDVARFGDDDTAIHIRCGSVSLHHESYNGQATDATTGRLVNLAKEYAAWTTVRQDRNDKPADPKSIPIHVDDDGIGGGVTDNLRAAGYRVVPLTASSTMIKRPDKYPNLRSELWFDCAARAKMKLLSFARLDMKQKHKIKVEAMAPVWKLDAAGRRVVEAKADTKKPDRLGFSPDNMDAVNLAYYEPPSMAGVAMGVEQERRPPINKREQSARRLYGR